MLERDDFWIGYLLVSYQADVSADVDPIGFFLGNAPYREGILKENTDVYDPNSGVPPGGIGASIFFEVIRDYDLKPPPIVAGDPLAIRATLSRTRTAPHEVGHQFGLGHNDGRLIGGIMSYTGDLYFTPNHINLMRWRVKSPGEGE